MPFSLAGPRPLGGRRRPHTIVLAAVATLAALAPSARAGAIRHQPAVHVKATLQATAVDPWGAYWQAALQHHWMHVKGPKAVSILTLSADGTLPVSPFVEYLQWRQSLHAKVFDSYHLDIARLLRHVSPIPSIADPSPTPGGRIPIEPPDFTPITPAVSTQGLNPPQVPEPASGVVALVMAGAGMMARRWARRSA